MDTLVFLDLDDTIFQTEAKCPPGQPITPAARQRNGEAASHITDRQGQFLRMLNSMGTVIPTTGRNNAALARVELPFESYRITNHGAVILDADGNPLVPWCETVLPQLRRLSTTLEDLAERTRQAIARLSLVARARVIGEFDVPTYVSVKAEDPASLLRLRTECESVWSDLHVHQNGRNLALLPPPTRKDRAVRFIIEQMFDGQQPLTIAIGDSLSDIPFLTVCDFAVTPRNSQIQAVTWAAHRVMP